MNKSKIKKERMHENSYMKKWVGTLIKFQYSALELYWFPDSSTKILMEKT